MHGVPVHYLYWVYKQLMLALGQYGKISVSFVLWIDGIKSIGLYKSYEGRKTIL